MHKVLAATIVAFGLNVGVAEATEIKDGKIVVKQQSSGTQLGFEPVEFPKSVRGISIAIQGPDGYEAMVLSDKRLPELDLAKFGKVVDGEYFFEITGGTEEKDERKEVLNNGRDKDEPSVFRFRNFALSGKLLVRRGSIVEFEQMVEKGSELTKPGEDVKDVDEGYKEVEDPGRRPKEPFDGDTGDTKG